MRTTTHAIFAGALMLAAACLPGNAAAKKVECRYRMPDSPAPAAAPRETQWRFPVEMPLNLAVAKREVANEAAAPDRDSLSMTSLRALARTIGQSPRGVRRVQW